MPITINGSGTIGGLNAGGLPDDCITTADIAANAVTYAKIGTTEQGQLCKAWVNFNGTTASPSTIRASYNVSSVTKGATGNYSINFTTAMVDANYSAVLTTASPYQSCPHVFTATTTVLQIYNNYVVDNSGNTLYDSAFVYAAIFR